MAQKFTVTPDHLILLRNLSIRWQDCEQGAPEVDPKRPYGNGDYKGDVARLLGWDVDDNGLTRAQEDEAHALHHEMHFVVGIACANPGVSLFGAWARRDYGPWQRLDDHPSRTGVEREYPYREDGDGWLNISPKAGEAAESVVRTFEVYAAAATPVAQADALTALSNHMSDLSSFVPPEEYED